MRSAIARRLVRGKDGADHLLQHSKPTARPATAPAPATRFTLTIGSTTDRAAC